MMENRKILTTSDLDGFDKRKLPSPGFQVEVVLTDYDGSAPPRPASANADKESGGVPVSATSESSTPPPNPSKDSGGQDKDDVFSDNEAEEDTSSKSKRAQTSGTAGEPKGSETRAPREETASITHGIEQVSLKSEGATPAPGASEPRSEGGVKSSPAMETPEPGSAGMSEFKAIAADASVFSFGDEDDYESE